MKFSLARLVPASAQPGPTVGADFIQANLYDPYPSRRSAHHFARRSCLKDYQNAKFECKINILGYNINSQWK
jgi:hypothetical protein